MTALHYKFYTATVTNEYRVLLHCDTSSINAEFQIKILHVGFKSDSFISGKKGQLNRKCLKKVSISDTLIFFFSISRTLRRS